MSVTIWNNVIIGANSTVTHDIPSNTVFAGSPARQLCTLDEYIAKERMKTLPVYGDEYTLRGGITVEMKQKQKEEISAVGGFVK